MFRNVVYSLMGWNKQEKPSTSISVIENQKDKKDSSQPPVNILSTSTTSTLQTMQNTAKDKDAKKEKDDDSNNNNNNSNNSNNANNLPVNKTADPVSSSDLLGTLQAEIQSLTKTLQEDQDTWETMSDSYFATGKYPSNTTVLTKTAKLKPTWLQNIEELFEKEAKSVWETMKEVLVPHDALEGLLKSTLTHLEKKKNESVADYKKLTEENSTLTQDDKNKLLSNMCLKNCEMLALMIILLNRVSQMIDKCLKFDVAMGNAANALENFIMKALGILVFKADITTFINNCKSDTDNDDLKEYRATLANKLEVPMTKVRLAVGKVKGDLLQFQNWLSTLNSKPSQNASGLMSASNVFDPSITNAALTNPTDQNVVQHFSSLKLNQ